MSHTLNGKHGHRDDYESEMFIANTLKGHNGKGGSGISPEDTFIAAPLSHGSNPNSNMAGRRREDDYNLVSGPLGDGNDRTGRRTEDDPNLVAYALRKDPGGTGQGHNTNYVSDHATVRRLTPTECERLQGLQDGWTDLGGTPDSRRYAALGDAVTAPVTHWIGARLVTA